MSAPNGLHPPETHKLTLKNNGRRTYHDYVLYDICVKFGISCVVSQATNF